MMAAQMRKCVCFCPVMPNSFLAEALWWKNKQKTGMSSLEGQHLLHWDGSVSWWGCLKLDIFQARLQWEEIRGQTWQKLESRLSCECHEMLQKEGYWGERCLRIPPPGPAAPVTLSLISREPRMDERICFYCISPIPGWIKSGGKKSVEWIHIALFLVTELATLPLQCNLST